MVRTGDLDELYAASYRRLVVQLYTRCGDLADAEDAVTEGFITAIRSYREVAGVGDPEGWVRAVAANRLRPGGRHASLLRRHRAGSAVPHGAGPEHVAILSAPPQRHDDRPRVVVLRPPSFDSLVTTAQRRSRRAALTAVGVAGAAAVLVLGAGALTGRDDRSVADPADTPHPARTAPVTAPVTEAFINRMIRVGRDPYAMAVERTTGVVYVTNRGDDTMSVIDPTAHGVTATIAVGHQPGDLVVDPTTGLVYVAAAGGAGDEGGHGSGVVSVVDPRTDEVVETIVLGPGELPGELALDPSNHALFVVSRTDTKVLVIDTDANQVVDAVDLGWAPGAVAVRSRTSEAYVTGHDARTLSVIDTGTREVVQTLQGFGEHVQVDPAGGAILVGKEGSGTVTVLDATTRQRLTTIDVGGYGPFSIEIDPLAARAYVTGGPDGTMAVLDTRNMFVVQDVRIPGASSVSADPVVDVARASVYLIVGRRDVGVMARK